MERERKGKERGKKGHEPVITVFQGMSKEENNCVWEELYLLTPFQIKTCDLK